jgi:hypothetical protein
VRQVVADPGSTSRFYAALPGQGICRSDDGGITWAPTNNAQLLAAGNIGRIKLAVHNSTNGNVVYAGLIDTAGAAGAVFRSADLGATWTSMAVPQTSPNSPLTVLQGDLHYSIVADPTDPNVVFVGG